MSQNSLSRRTFLKAMGLGGAGSAVLLSGCGDTDIINAVSIEVNKEKVYPQVDPQEFSIPGVGVNYASTCRQCPANCGIHALTRQGRTTKLEGNPSSYINNGRLCSMGQAGIQNHYHPDRLRKPLMRRGGSLVEVSWDDALDALSDNLAKKNSKLAWLSGAVSGHHAALIQSYLDGAGSSNFFAFDTLPPAIGHAANEAVFGHAVPKLDIEKADLILSFGADFLGTWVSPVHFATAYGKFRSAPRGTLVQVEPKMTLTGANADRWIAIRPGTEGHLALALASLLAKDSEYAARIPGDVVKSVAGIDLNTVSKITDVSVDRIRKLARLLKSSSSSLILSGPSAEGVEHGFETARAVLMLNVMLGSVGKTLLPRSESPLPDLAPQMGGWAEVKAFLDGLASGEFDTAVIFGSNPLYQAPDFMKAKEAFSKAKYRIAFSQFMDETVAETDLVLPIHSYLEEWNTTMPAYDAEDGYLGLQQPVMNPVFGDGTRSFGDLMLGLLKKMRPEFEAWDNYQAYVVGALMAMKPVMVNPPEASVAGQIEVEALRDGVLSTGFVQIKTKKAAAIVPNVEVAVMPKAPKPNSSFPFKLIPSARLGLWDGRHANIAWLQELPDQLTYAMWNSWAEIHPKTAERLDVKTGDVVRVTSSKGSLDVIVFVFSGIHPEAVGIPLGQGHTNYGSNANGIGVNPHTILAPHFDGKTGELATHATDVQIVKIRSDSSADVFARGELVLDGGSDTQGGSKLVKTVTAEQFARTDGAKLKGGKS